MDKKLKGGVLKQRLFFRHSFAFKTSFSFSAYTVLKSWTFSIVNYWVLHGHCDILRNFMTLLLWLIANNFGICLQIRNKEETYFFLIKHGGIRIGLLLLQTPLLYLLPNSYPFPQLITEHSNIQHYSNRNVCDRSQRKKSLFNHKQFCD